MYVQHWNLDSAPFDNNIDPAFFFRSRTHHAALLKLRYLLDSNKGVGLLCGDTGTGKTTVARLLVGELDARFAPVVHVHYPFLNATELVAYLAAELGGDEEALQGRSRLDFTLRQFESRLAYHCENGRHPLIVIDEAHLIEDQQVLQAIQLLLNYRHDAPFTVLLVGQTSLLSRIGRLTELDERIGVRSLIQPLNREETAEYVTHRLSVAGVTHTVFEPSALDEIHDLSGGLPRRINRMADLSLLVGYADGLTTLTENEVATVADEIGLAITE
jgi:general secretion pathway protein A